LGPRFFVMLLLAGSVRIGGITGFRCCTYECKPFLAGKLFVLFHRVVSTLLVFVVKLGEPVGNLNSLLVFSIRGRRITSGAGAGGG
jgi:hypothetical protein